MFPNKVGNYEGYCNDVTVNDTAGFYGPLISLCDANGEFGIQFFYDVFNRGCWRRLFIWNSAGNHWGNWGPF